jgi:hypothetical protein
MKLWATVVGVVVIAAWAGGGVEAWQRGAGTGPAGAPPAPIGVIVGRVVDAASGLPVPEAQVSVTSRTAAPPAPPAPGTVPGAGNIVRLLTGADGRFMVRDLPAGNVMVSVQAPGYLNGNYGQASPSLPAGRPIVISVENRVVDAVVKMWKHAVVTGVVTDEGNEPAINIAVRALRRSFTNGKPRYALVGLGRTDDRGVYRIAAMAPGDYVIAVPQTQMTMPAAVMDSAMNSMLGGDGFSASLIEAAVAGGMGASGGMGLRVGDQMINSMSGAAPVLSGDGRMAAYVTQFFPAAGSLSDATIVTLASGQVRTGIDLRMPLVPTVRIGGMVTGPEGPLPNVTVRLVPVADAVAADSVSEVARASTAADGSFVLLGVPVGSYVAKVLKAPRVPMPAEFANNPQLQALMGGRGGGPGTASDALTLFADVPVSAERDVDGLVVVLSTGATVSGRVEFVGSAAAPPTAGFTVSLQSAVGTSMSASMQPARLRDDGTFVTPGYPAGPYFLNAVGRLPGWFIKSAIVNGVDALEQPFELTAENVGNVIVTVVDRLTGVSGTVTGGSGAPAQGTVIIFPAAYREWIARGMPQRLMRNLRTQPTGAFSLPQLPPRDYLLVAVADTDVPDMQNPAVYEALARAAMSVTLIEGETRTVALRLTQVGK